MASAARSGRSAGKVSARVVCPDGQTREAFFDSRQSLADQVRGACQDLGLTADAEDEEFFLTLGSGAATVIGSKAALANYLQKPGEQRLYIRKAAAVAESHLNEFKEAAGPSRSEAAERLRQAVKADSLIAEAVIDQNGLQDAFRLALDTKCADSPPLALLCELLQQDSSSSDWLEDHHDEKEIAQPLFDCLVASLFPPEDAEPRAGSSQRLCLGILLFLLQELPHAPKAVHQALLKNRPEEDESFYTSLVSLLDDECADFQARAAQLTLRSLLYATREDLKLQQQVADALEGASTQMKAELMKRSLDLKASFDQLVVSYMGACTEVASSSLTGGGRGPEKLSKLEREIEHLQDLNATMKVQLRRQNAAMHRMVTFVTMDHEPVVEQALEGIIRLGWDSLNWKRGYTMLHYCAECVEDPLVVELIGLLATDIDRKDHNNKRPIDYARESGRENIIKTLEKLRKISRKLAAGAKVTSEQGEKEPVERDLCAREPGSETESPEKTPRKDPQARERFTTRSQSMATPKVKVEADVKQMLQQATDMKPALRSAVEKVLDKGWHAVTWPSNFSAVHLAARFGDVTAIDILAEARADLSRADDWQLTPIDYAAQKGNHEVVAALQKHLAKAKELEASGRNTESSGRQRASRAAEAVSRSPSPCGAAESARAEAPPSPRTPGRTVAFATGNQPRGEASVSASPGSPGTPGTRTSPSTPDSSPSSGGSTTDSPGGGSRPADPKAVPSQSHSSRASTASPTGGSGRLSTAKGAPMDPGPIPDGLRPELQKACEAVKRRGWAKIKWPHDFTALHLAAQFGEEKAVEFLLRASAEPGLATEDSKGLRPLEYAINKGHKNLVPLLSPKDPAGDGGIADAGPAQDAAPAAPAAPTAGVPGKEPTRGNIAASPQTSGPQEAAQEDAAQPQGAAGGGGGEVAATTGSSSPLKAGKSSALAAQVQKVLIKQRMIRTFTGDMDLLQERLRSRDKDGEDAGLADLREEIRKLKVENQALRHRSNASHQEPATAGSGPAGGSGGGALAGPLTEDMLGKYLFELETFGKDKVFGKLMDSPLAGGQALSEADATAAVRQMDMILRLAKVAQAPLSEGTPADGGNGSAGSPPQAKAKGKGPPGPGGKGKKGPPPPGAAASEEPAKAEATEEDDLGSVAKEDAPASTEAAPAPKAGKAKGKGPPPPGGKGKGPPMPKAEGAAPAEEAKAEGAAEEAAPKAGKGPKGPKGPAKGPGKGPPAPGGGKGPAAPAGKGPGGPPGAKGGAKGGKGGKPGKGVSLETKPAVKPSQQMKPLWWNKMLFGAQLQKGETIWDEVKDDMDKLPIGELTLRFSKAAIAQKEKPKKEEGEKKKEEVTLIRIITDPQIVVGKEASLRKLPEPSEVAKALDELNDKILDLEMLQVVKDNACPNPAQLKELGEARQKNPNVPLALPESFMWVIGNMPAYQQRIDVWSFAQSYKEQHASYDVALRDFLSVVECFQESEMLPSLLGIILAVGNYLNGGTNRGQADAFDLETFGKLEGIKDAAGKDVRHFIFDLFLNQMTDQASQFLEEITPCMVNINRRIAKDSDGVEKLDKSARIVFEDFDLCVNALHGEFVAKHETMQMILSYFEDPADPFKLQMPAIYAEAKEKLDALLALKDTAKEKYAQLLKWFKIQTMKSSDFCVLWDNLMVPGNMILNADMKMKKDFMIPTFCQNKPFTTDDLQILWQFKEFDAKSKVTKKKVGQRRRRRFSQRLRDAQAAADKAQAAAAEAAGTGAAGEAPAAGAAPGGKAKGKPPPAGKGKKGPGAAPAAAAPAAAEPGVETAAATPEAAPTEGGAPAAPAGKGKAKGPAKGKKGPGAPPAAAPAAAEAADAAAPAEAEVPAAAAEAEAPAAPAASKGKAKGPAKGKKGPGPPPAAAAETAEAPSAEAAAAPAQPSEEAAEAPAAAAEAEAPAAPAAGKGKAKGPAKGKKGPGPPPAAASADVAVSPSGEEKPPAAGSLAPVESKESTAGATQKDADAPLPDDEDLDVALETSPASPGSPSEASSLHPVALQAAKGPPPAKGKAKGPGKPGKGPPLPPTQG